MLCSLTNLSDADLLEISRLEEQIGKPLLAFSCHDIPPAKLSEDEMERIRGLEKKLGMSLVAVESKEKL